MSTNEDEPFPGAEDISDEFSNIASEHDLPALVGLAASGQNVLAYGVTGARKVDTEQRVTVDDRFHLGSNTKAMTATVAAMLDEEDTLGLDDDLSMLFPDLADEMHEAYRDVTIAQLLAHHGGMGEADDFPERWQRAWSDTRPLPRQRKEWTEAILTTAPATKPGAASYSNLGYVVVGAAMEEATESSWEQLMEQYLFEPLDMDSGGFGAPVAVSGNEPCGHTEEEGQLVAVEPGPADDNPAFFGPAGTVHCNATDWLRFLRLHLNALQGNAELLSPGQFQRLHQPWEDSGFSLGWALQKRPWAGGTALFSSGSNTMFYATAWVAGERDRIYLALTNRFGNPAAVGLDTATATLIDFVRE